MSNTFVFDIEADNLLDEITKIHCLSYSPVDKLEVKSLTNYEDILDFISQEGITLIGHNIVRYDIPALKKILSCELNNLKKVVDTLGISYYLNSSKDKSFKHGLEAYGERLGHKKKVIEDWKEGTIESYVERCEGDVIINWMLWKQQQRDLMSLYDKDSKEVIRLIDYITFKFDCLREQSENRVPLDIDLAITEMLRLEGLVNEKRNPLLEAMPKIPIKSKKKKPKVIYKADGSLSLSGESWFKFLDSQGLSKDTDGEVEFVSGYEEPNPDSNSQIKDWLFSLGWNPEHCKFQRDKKTGEVKQIPQIKSEYDSTDICESIKELATIKPEVEYLASYSTIKHRLGVIKGFIRDADKDLKLEGDALGLTNTFRLKHKVIVNLPKPSAPYAENIRACLIAGEGNYMVGADLSGIEDNTKLHYIYPLDPEYVKTMQGDDWDAHLDIAVRANLLTQEQADAHKAGTASYKEERTKAKIVNFSSTYGVGAKTLARNMKTSEKEAKKILETYWERNWAVKRFSESCEVKTVDNQMWVRQPVSRFWISLRSNKDVFSSVNQSTAVYVFDTWVKYLREEGLKISMQMHDEVMIIVPNSVSQEETKLKVNKAIQKVNEELKLNVEIKCSIDFGINYKEVH